MKSAKKFLGLGVLVTLNLSLQFLFQWYIIISFGAGPQSDAFFGAMALPQFILLVLSGSLTMVLIPMISRYSGDEFISEAWNYFQGIGLLFSAISLLLLFTAGWWVKWILPGFDAKNHALALDLARIQLIAMTLSAMLSILWAIHSARENFYIIETSSIAANLIAFVLLILAIKYSGIYAAAWVSVLRVLLQVLFLVKILGGYRRPQFHSASFKEAWKKIRPLIAGNMYVKTDTLVDKYLTSSSPASGDLTLLNLAQQLYSMGSNILAKVFVNTIIPSLSLKAHSNKPQAMHQAYRRRLWLLLIISAIVYLIILLVGQPLLQLVFGFKNFSSGDVHNLWMLLVLLFGFWIAGLLGALTSGTFYAKGDTVTPTRITVILFTLYIPVKIYVFRHYGIRGLAISISTYYILSMLLQMVFLEMHKEKKINHTS